MSPNSGFGMNVTVLPAAWAVDLMMYLKSMSLSACASRELNRMLISAWPAVPTSWCCISTWMPAASRLLVISERRSTKWSIGGTGK